MQYDVIIKIKSQKGKCNAGHKVGDEVIFRSAREGRLEGNICPNAFNVLYRYIYAIKYGAEIPWMKDGAITAACPDPKNTVVFELIRKKAEE